MCVGTDSKSGLVHSLAVETAKVADIEMAADVLHGDEKAIYGDAGFIGMENREDIKEIYGAEEVARPKPKKNKNTKVITKIRTVDFQINRKRMKIARMPDGEEKTSLQAEEKTKSSVLLNRLKTAYKGNWIFVIKGLKRFFCVLEVRKTVLFRAFSQKDFADYAVFKRFSNKSKS